MFHDVVSVQSQQLNQVFNIDLCGQSVAFAHQKADTSSKIMIQFEVCLIGTGKINDIY